MIRICIVEDEVPIATLIQKSLHQYGYACTAVHDGLKAADLLERETFDLLLLDVMLPGADGWQLRGESPWECFPGDPRSFAGYGCYAPVIARAMEACCGERLTVQLLLGTDLSTLCRYVAEDTPVLIWATMGMLPAYEGQHWLLPDGSTFTFICPEHALLLIGFDGSRCYFSDPQRPDAVTAYSRAKTEAAFAAMGGQAIVCRPK